MSFRKIRVLIVDDAVAIRRIVAGMLEGDPDIEVADTAANGRIALQKVTQVSPDILVLDIEMPEMNGLDVLRALRKTHPRLPVIVFSTLTERGAAATIEALTLGASDYVTKPASIGSRDAAFDHVRGQLVPKIKALCSALLPPVAPAIHSPPMFQQGNGQPRSIEVIAIGVSTGGPNALAKIIPELPAGFPVPIVVVQHMPPLFTKLLADRLNAQSPLAVREARAGEELLPGSIYIAPGDFHLTVERKGVRVLTALNQAPPENSCRPSVDVLLRSVTDAYRSAVLAIVLTGMGQDGLRGCEGVKQAGGTVVVQDEATSVVWGMPGFVARAGLADRVLPLGGMAADIVRSVSTTLAAPRPIRLV